MKSFEIGCTYFLPFVDSDRLIDHPDSWQARKFVPQILKMSNTNGTLTFIDFVQYLIGTSPEEFDSHWARIADHCQPELIHYDAIVQIETIEDDMKQFVINQMNEMQTKTEQQLQKATKDEFSFLVTRAMPKVTNNFKVMLQSSLETSMKMAVIVQPALSNFLKVTSTSFCDVFCFFINEETS